MSLRFADWLRNELDQRPIQTDGQIDMPESSQLLFSDLSVRFVNWWPAAAVAFGLLLTLIWTGFLIGFPLYLMDII